VSCVGVVDEFGELDELDWCSVRMGRGTPGSVEVTKDLEDLLQLRDLRVT
jgi:hypothetical protein